MPMNDARHGLAAITLFAIASLAPAGDARAAAPSGPDTLVLPSRETWEIGGVNWTSPVAAGISAKWPGCSSTASTMSKPTAIVLHETGYMKPTISHAGNKCVHFLITRGGTIIQLAPLDRAWGTSPSGGHSINIEMANGDDDGRNYALKGGTNRIGVDWMGAPYLYWMTDPQLEAAWNLVDLLTREDFDGDGASDIPRVVANASLIPAYFFFSAQGQTVSPSVDASLTSTFKGIMSHSINGAGELRNDGGVAAAYVHFRLEGASHVTALCVTQRLATRPREKSLTTAHSDLGITGSAFANHTWVPLALNETDEACTSYKSMDVPVEGPVLDLGGDGSSASSEVLDLGGDDQ